MKTFACGWLAACLWICCGSSASADLITFEELHAPPGLTNQTGLKFANNGSSTWQGITWDARVNVVGNEYRVDPATPGPLYGSSRPGSNYAITNSDNNGAGNDGIVLTTTQTLLGAWFGQAAYYGYGNAGASQITISALNGSTKLESVVFDLPTPSPVGQPGPLAYVDTSIFAGVDGITGYQIDRVTPNQYGGNWVADDFLFVASAPEPASMSMLALSLVSLGGLRVVRRRK